jgi:glyoxylase-like metal-dependent hydrolase (beta-lactamase superfamily II)
MKAIIPLDLNFMNRRGAIAAYLIPYKEGVVLVESGPQSTLDELCKQLKQQGIRLEEVTHVLITHIHLDHAGAAGWLASKGAQIYVHPVGEPHLKNPEKLLESVKRIYGDKMDFLWGQFKPVPEDKIFPVQDNEKVIAGDISFTAIHTPGHAEHHISWLFEDTCFTGDVGGIRMPGSFYIRLPLVPPELNFEKWRVSIKRLMENGFHNIAPTHFGIFNDVRDHLSLVLQILDENERWMENAFSEEKPIELIRKQYVDFLNDHGRKFGISEDALKTYEIANPTWMGADGLQRYWKKNRK